MTARKRTYSDAVRRRAEQLIRSGRTQRDTQATLAREFGSPPSLGWLGNLGKAVSLDRQARVSEQASHASKAEQTPAGGEQVPSADGEQATPEASGSPSSPGAPPAAPPAGDDEQAGPVDIARMVRLLEVAASDVAAAAATAREDGDLSGVARAARSLVGIAESLRRLQPPPTADIEEQPDFVEAARRCQEKLHELVDRAIARRNEHPRCPTCGQPVVPEDADLLGPDMLAAAPGSATS